MLSVSDGYRRYRLIRLCSTTCNLQRQTLIAGLPSPTVVTTFWDMPGAARPYPGALPPPVGLSAPPLPPPPPSSLVICLPGPDKPYDGEEMVALPASRTLSIRMKVHHRFCANRRMYLLPVVLSDRIRRSDTKTDSCRHVF